MTEKTVLDFWFTELQEAQWFKKDPALDKAIKERFLPLYKKAIAGDLVGWRKTIEGRLAEIIVLDQFSRNMFRDQAQAFLFDPLALILAQEASSLPEVKKLPAKKRAFMYLPFMHSESTVAHEQAVLLFSEPGLENNLIFEHKHKVIIDRFGRYPHRNEILGRASTAEEINFLNGPDSSF